jgi:hypothetical protein
LKTWGEWRYSSTILYLGTRSQWVVSYTPQLLYPKESARGTRLTGGWVGLTPGLDAVEWRKISCPYRESNLGRPAFIPSLYRPVITLYIHSKVIIISWKWRQQVPPKHRKQSSGQKIGIHWRWKQHIPPKLWYPHARLRVAIALKTAVLYLNYTSLLWKALRTPAWRDILTLRYASCLHGFLLLHFLSLPSRWPPPLLQVFQNYKHVPRTFTTPDNLLYVSYCCKRI